MPLIAGKESSHLGDLALVLQQGLRKDTRLEEWRHRAGSFEVLSEIVHALLLCPRLPLLVVFDENLSTFSLDLIEELLSMAPNLCTRPGDNIFLNTLPVLAKELES